MAIFNISIPKMGESITEVTIIKWLKNKGEQVKEDEPILEIATDKVDSEIASPADGVIIEVLHSEGVTLEVGKLVAVVSTNGETLSINQQNAEKTDNLYKKTTNIELEKNSTLIKEDKKTELFISPLVKNIAKKENISKIELGYIKGTGKDNRITKIDLLNYIEQKNKTSKNTNNTKINENINESKIPLIVNNDDEIIEMDRMRKIIAEHMVHSKQTSPHVTSFLEVDVTNIVIWRNKIKSIFETRENEKITFTPIFIEAIAKTIKDFPLINSSTDGERIFVKKKINIGMATALPSGNLIVPVIKNADQLNLIGITKAVNDLSNRARSNKLHPEDIQEGTFTLTNLGSFGTDFGTPIINQPQAAIIAVGAIKKKPVVIETPTGDSIGIRNMMYISLAYDHRIIDGALGGNFLKSLGQYLSNFDINREV